LRAKTKSISKTKSKPKRPSLPSLIAKADKLASQYIRQKFADHNGMVKCVSCETVLHWKHMQCCHYIDRGKKACRWDERNLMPGCVGCNCYHKQAHMRAYQLYLIDTHGRELVDELMELERKVLSSSQVRQLAEEAITYYGSQLQALQS
jgi:hypothetical protein